MTAFLIALSLILNIIALFAIIILYLRQNRLLQVERKQEKLITEMEEVISTYLVQMKEENESFINRVKTIDSQQKEYSPEKITSEYNKEKWQQDPTFEKVDLPVDRTLQKKMGKVVAQKAVSLYKKNGVTHMKEDILNKDENLVELPSLEESSLIDQILQLKEGGLSIENIARKLNKGKTEVELLLKFHQK